MRVNRLNEMESYVFAQGSASLEGLSRQFNISLNTARRDVNELLKRGTIQKVYGGVIASPQQATPIPISSRETCNTEAKHIIAQLAASQISDGATIFMDNGTTVSAIVPFLAAISGLVIVTNSLTVISEAPKYPSISFYSLGGFYNKDTSSFVGDNILQALDGFSVDMAFIGTTGITIENGLTTGAYFERPIKRHIMEHCAKRRIVLADTTKFGRNALFSFAGIRDFDVIITEAAPPKNFADFFQLNNIRALFPMKGESHENVD